jgi:hypothetical protein
LRWLTTKNLLRYSRLRLPSFHNLCGPHAVDKHTSKHGCCRVNNTHLRSLRNLLLVTGILFSDIFRRLDTEWFSQLISP